MNWDVAIDLGTDKMRMAEFSLANFSEAAALLAYRAGSQTPVMGGNYALKMRGHTYQGMRVVAPLRDGTLESGFHASQLLRWAFSRLTTVNHHHRFNVLISCQPFARPVQREALVQAALDAGAASVGLVRADAAAALGAGLDFFAPEGKLVLDVGAGHMSATLFSFGHAVSTAYLPYGLNRIDERILRILSATEGYRVGLSTAQEIKHTLGAAKLQPDQTDVIMRAKGFSLADALPRTFDVHPKPIFDACEEVTREFADLCATVVSAAPQELAADLNDSGAILTGAGAEMTGLQKRIADTLGIPCTLADNAGHCCIRGLHRIMHGSDDDSSCFLEAKNAAGRRQI